MLNIVFQGLITGFILTLSFGAGFFALIQTSISKGIKNALLIAFGSIISDFIYILFTLFATSFISNELPKYSQSIKIIGLIALVFLGIRTILKSSKVKNTGETTNNSSLYYLSKGFLLNSINPMILLTWIGISVYLESTFEYSHNQMIVYFGTVLIAVFLTQLCICYFSNKIKSYLSEKIVHRFNIVIGFIFIMIGLALFFTNQSPEQSIEKARIFLK